MARNRKLGLLAAIAVLTIGGLSMAELVGSSRAACPADSAEARQTLGLLTTGSALTMPAGLEVVVANGTCSKLRNAVKDDYKIAGANASWDATYYMTPDTYYVVLLPKVESDPTVGSFGSDVVIVLDASFAVIETLFG